MKVLRDQKYLIALLALLAVFAACKGESPTAPTPSGGGGGGVGGGTPPSGATIVLTVSNPNPQVNSTSIITATVTQNNNPVPNGTAVEFSTNLGTFTDTGTNTTIRTTTNGVATATLTSATPGTANIIAIVNNVSVKTNVVFSAAPSGGTPVPTAPTISSVTPSTGLSGVSQLLTITGTNFRTPIRVLFDLGNGVIKEGFVDQTRVTPTSLVVLTPVVDVAPGQSIDSTLILINEAGTTAEQRATTTFTFRLAQLTPDVTTVSPDSGPIGGGTRITIFGHNFESPVQVSFSSGQGFAQMQVISVTSTQIIAITPTARDVNPTGSGTLLGPVDLRIININSGTTATLTNAFRYTPAMQITGARPLAGSSLGGTDVTIDGIGFDPPVDVFIGGLLAQTIRVSGTQILARTSPLAVPCSSSAGTITVVNINNGDSDASSVSFNYIGVPSIITGVSSGGPIVPGSTITVTVQDPGIGPLGNAIVRFSINGTNVTPTPNVVIVGTGAQTFTMVVPATGFTFPTITCTTASMTPGTQLGPIQATLIFTNATTGCTATLDNGLTINPPGPNTCLQPPSPSVSPASPTCGNAGNASNSGTGFPTSTTTTFTVSNAPNSQPLNVTSVTIAGAGAADYSISPTTASNIPGGGSQVFTVTFAPAAVVAPTARNANITFQTNGTPATVQACVNGTANP